MRHRVRFSHLSKLWWFENTFCFSLSGMSGSKTWKLGQRLEAKKQWNIGIFELRTSAHPLSQYILIDKDSKNLHPSFWSFVLLFFFRTNDSIVLQCLSFVICWSVLKEEAVALISTGCFTVCRSVKRPVWMYEHKNCAHGRRKTCFWRYVLNWLWAT